MSRAGPISMVIVDDDELIGTSMRRELRRAHATIRLATTAREALVLVAAEVPDLLLSDYRMPGEMDGLALLTKVHADHPEVLCVLHTGEPPEVTQASAFRVLSKPCGTGMLLQIIEQAAQRRAE